MDWSNGLRELANERLSNATFLQQVIDTQTDDMIDDIDELQADALVPLSLKRIA